MKLMIRLVLLAALTTGIGSSTALGQTVGPMFPLHVGNSWTFQTFSGQYTETIVAKEEIAGDTWYLFDTFRDTDSVWAKLGDDRIVTLRKNGIQSKWVDFYSPLSGTWKAFIPGHQEEFTATLISRTESLTVPYGMFTNVYHIYFAWDGADNDIAEYYVEYIGPIKRILYGFAVIETELVHFNSTTSTDNIPSVGATPFMLSSPYPNPSSEGITCPIRVDAAVLQGEYLVSDILGNTVYGPKRFSLNSGQYNLTLPAFKFSAGQYVLRVSGGGAAMTKMLTIQ